MTVLSVLTRLSGKPRYYTLFVVYFACYLSAPISFSLNTWFLWKRNNVFFGLLTVCGLSFGVPVLYQGLQYSAKRMLTHHFCFIIQTLISLSLCLSHTAVLTNADWSHWCWNQAFYLHHLSHMQSSHHSIWDPAVRTHREKEKPTLSQFQISISITR